MATVTFSADIPEDLRLPDLFTEILGAITFGTSGGNETATFKIQHPDGYVEHRVDVFYSGPQLSDDGGGVSYLRFSYEGDTWLTIGVPDGPVLFTYDDLRIFHRNGAVAAAAVLYSADNLTGSANGDFMESYAGDDVLDGGGDADTLHGGSGNDTYIVDNSADRVVEAVGEGYDIVDTGVNFALAEDSEVEVLRASASGWALTLIGNRFANQIIGTSGNDLLDGKGGVDILIGGAGDDIYLVDNAWDNVIEGTFAGYDTVITTASYRLSGNVEVATRLPMRSSAIPESTLSTAMTETTGSTAMAATTSSSAEPAAIRFSAVSLMIKWMAAMEMTFSTAMSAMTP
jgi:serralysin